MTEEHEMQTQQTLDGGSLEAQRVECDYYDGCRSDAEYIVDQLVYGEGIQEIAACEGCTDEFLETHDEERIREIRIPDRWVEA